MLVVVGDRVDGNIRPRIFERALKLAKEMDRHVILLDVQFASFGSPMPLIWLL